MEVGGTRYAGYDELVSMKVASGRDEDLRDFGALEAARRTADHHAGDRESGPGMP